MLYLIQGVLFPVREIEALIAQGIPPRNGVKNALAQFAFQAAVHQDGARQVLTGTYLDHLGEATLRDIEIPRNIRPEYKLRFSRRYDGRMQDAQFVLTRDGNGWTGEYFEKKLKLGKARCIITEVS
jgi:hypothetical protein